MAIEMHFPEDEKKKARRAEAEIAMAPMPVAVRNEALTVPDRARELVVADQRGLDTAKEMLHAIDELMGRIDESFDPQINQAHKLHKSLLAEKKKFSDPLEHSKALISRKSADFIGEQERLRREKERERLEAEARASEIADKAIGKAEKLIEDGKDKAANAILDKATEETEKILAAAPEIPDKLDTIGLTVRENWTFSIVDAALIPREYLIPDEKKIGRIVRATKGEANIPGVRVYAEKGIATRTWQD
jgi:hypothetical protein